MYTYCMYSYVYLVCEYEYLFVKSKNLMVQYKEFVRSLTLIMKPAGIGGCELSCREVGVKFGRLDADLMEVAVEELYAAEREHEHERAAHEQHVQYGRHAAHQSREEHAQTCASRPHAIPYVP